MTRADTDSADVAPAALLTTGEPPGQAGRRMAIFCCLVALALSAALAALSTGVHHDDDLTHFLFAKWTRQDPAYLLNEWGRPGFTVLYALPAQIGWLAARLTSGVLTVLAAWLAYRTAEQMELRRAWLVAPLVLIQPMFLQLSYTTLTETPLALYLALAVWLLTQRRYGGSAAVLSLALLTRHEAVVWLPVWAMAFWLGRARWTCYLWLFWAPLLHNLLGPFVLGHAPIMMFFEPKANPEYGTGSALAMIARAQLAFGPGMASLACLGIPMICRRRWGWVVAGAVVVYFLFHAGCRFLGLYATGGYARFLVPICPMLGILAVAAINGLSEWRTPRWWLRAAGVTTAFVVLWLAGEREMPWWIYPPFVLAHRLVTAGVVLLTAAAIFICLKRPRLAWVRWSIPFTLITLTAIQTGYLSRPWKLSDDQRAVRSVAEWLKANGYGGRQVMATHVWMHVFWPAHLIPDNWNIKRRLTEAPAGTLFVWDKNYSPSFHQKMHLADYLKDPNYRLLTKNRSTRDVFCCAFEKRPPQATSAASRQSAPQP